MMGKLFVISGLATLLTLSVVPQRMENAKSAEEILQSYVEDFRQDPAAAEPITFGVRVRGGGGGDWHVIASGRKPDAKQAEVVLRRNLPTVPAALYTLDLATLRKIERGEMNALTAMARARSTDVAPMDIEFMLGYQPEPTFFARFIPFTFHFWTRGLPETIPYGKSYSRVAHGGNVVIFYYQKGFRSAWAQIEKGQHVNKDPKDQVNEFPTLVIAIHGKAVAKIGGKEVVMRPGQAVFIPAGTSHEVWNPYDEAAEVVLLMFGEGA